MCILHKVTSLYKDSVWITVDQTNLIKALIGTIFCSGSLTTVQKYDELLHEVLSHVTELGQFTLVVIVGDFNHGSIKWLEKEVADIKNPRDLEFATCIQNCLLFQHATTYTRSRHNQAPRILDLTHTIEKHTVCEVKVVDNLGKSDNTSFTFYI